jgi:hypothetical protein
VTAVAALPVEVLPPIGLLFMELPPIGVLELPPIGVLFIELPPIGLLPIVLVAGTEPLPPVTPLLPVAGELLRLRVLAAGDSKLLLELLLELEFPPQGLLAEEELAG